MSAWIGGVMMWATVSGILPGTVDLLTDVLRLAPDFGWRATISDADTPGRVTVRIAASEGEASAWFDARAASHGLQHDLVLGATTAVTDGAHRVLWRLDNLVVDIERPAGEAADLAERLLAAVQTDSAWPDAPRVRRRGERVEVPGSWAEVAVTRRGRFEPGSLLPSTPIATRTADGGWNVPADEPAIVTVWDAFGRGHRVTAE